MSGKGKGKKAGACGLGRTRNRKVGPIKNDTHRSRRGRFARKGSPETIRYKPYRIVNGRFCPK